MNVTNWIAGLSLCIFIAGVTAAFCVRGGLLNTGPWMVEPGLVLTVHSTPWPAVGLAAAFVGVIGFAAVLSSRAAARQ